MKARPRGALRIATWSLGALLCVVAGGYLCVAWWFAPALDGERRLSGLSAPARVDSDHLGVPAIHATSRHDALLVLGFVTARDRLFQMDLLRRHSAGELAEVFGPDLLESDVHQRRLGMQQVARAIVARLPAEQRQALDAYVSGVNALISSSRAFGPEFTLLGYRPRPWTAADSMLVVLGMFQVLNGSEELERTRTLLERKAPADLVNLVYGSSDPYTEHVLGTLAATRNGPKPSQTFPGAAYASGSTPGTVLHPRAGEARPGSNAWVVAGSRTRDGRAILANDMHLDLAIPNVWYRAELHYAGSTLRGVTLPGVPLVIAGSNEQVAWGFTNLEGDVLDLVELEVDAKDAQLYRTPEGMQRFVQRRESIKVAGAAAETVLVRSTIWGPVSERNLVGRPVAVRWSALDASAVDLGLVAIDRARSVDDARAVMNRAGMPPLNALLADRKGRIAWTLTGRIPRREGLVGASARSWASGSARWNGYLAPDELPRIVDPAVGFLVNANQPMPRAAEAPVLGHDFGNGYRAYRVAERIAAQSKVDERALFSLQFDTRSELYDLYRDAALEALHGWQGANAKDAEELRRALVGWDGRAELSSVGFAVLVRFRRALVQHTVNGWFGGVKEPNAALDFADLDTPVRAALTSREGSPFGFHRGGRIAVLRESLTQALREVKAEAPGKALDSLRWSDVSRAQLEHPLGSLPLLGSLLNMPAEPLAGCGACVRMAAGVLGPSERLVVSPGHEADALLHMPGGESGNPFSPHYRDQQEAWSRGRPLALNAGPARHTLRFLPAAPAQH